MELVAGAEVFGLDWDPVLEMVGWNRVEWGPERSFVEDIKKAFLVPWLLMAITCFCIVRNGNEPQTLIALRRSPPYSSSFHHTSITFPRPHAANGRLNGV